MIYEIKLTDDQVAYLKSLLFDELKDLEDDCYGFQDYNMIKGIYDQFPFIDEYY